ncbi:hypothetical protein [Cellulomonas endophytica]|uniref:hypothetical protein n=1 Tax=Cellulomonas endophytica TaxID=2494735 RepID=UPI0010116D31|nr:hypothetical protein [Cellulomonas endophytica]
MLGIRATATATAAAALLVLAAVLTPAAAAPPGPGFHSGQPIKAFEYQHIGNGDVGGLLTVQVVCPTDGTYALLTSFGRLNNWSYVRNQTEGQVVPCTGHPQKVQVDLYGEYYGSLCRLVAGPHLATARLVEVLPGEPWEINLRTVATTSRTMELAEPTPGAPCDIWE